MQTTQLRLLERYKLGLAVGWTVVISALCCMNLLHQRAQILETARTQARSNFQRDTLYRQWNAANGSVYVELGKETPPNPYLSHFTERDVTTTTGKKLTLVNPAYMSRLVFDMAARNKEPRGHITSLRPIRPENRPDPWEAKALRAFQRGEKEVSSVEEMGGVSYLRLMSPLITEKDCLQCHGKDGYRVGDIRGGISVDVPLEPFWKLLRQNVLLHLLSFTLLWGAGLAGIFLGAYKLRKTVQERDAAEQGVADLNRSLLALTEELQAANAELETFCATVSHDLRSPLTGIGGYCQLIQELPSAGHFDRCVHFAGIMLEETRRMERLIDTLLNFSRLTRGEFKRASADLSQMAGEVALELHQCLPERKVHFRIQEAVTAEGDPALLRVVLQNLLSNAWKYTGEREQAVIEFGASRCGSETVYFVRDNGIGFEAAESERMFEAFRRLSNASNFDGVGIGLATVKRIVNRHGGRIWCEGGLDSGATFYFTLPLAGGN